MPLPSINPNSDAAFLTTVDIDHVNNYPRFLYEVKFLAFKQIDNLTIKFKNPISIISGANKIGKTTILMALACSHVDFKKRNQTNGNFTRHTWSSFIKFTSSDIQSVDWSYWITYREGNRAKSTKRGQRKRDTGKWNGIGKKEGQIKNRQVVFIDLERILPGRNTPTPLFNKARESAGTIISNITLLRIMFSYIFEETYTDILKLAQHVDKMIFAFRSSANYSGYNAASGEDVIIKMLIDILEAQENALILIDEIEIGLHPKVQKRLMDVLKYISRYQKKQFIITTHSPTVLSNVSAKSRIFIDKNIYDGFVAIQEASIHEALSKMDANMYPLVDLFCEDDVAEKIIKKSLEYIQSETSVRNISLLTNVIISGSAQNTYDNFKIHERTYGNKKIRTGYICVLDGDMKNKLKSDGQHQFPEQEHLFFLPGIFSPERVLLNSYLESFPHSTLEYHSEHGNPHSYFNKMVEEGVAVDKNTAFEMCWQVFQGTEMCKTFMREFTYFLITSFKKFSN